MALADKSLCEMPQSEPRWAGTVDLYIFRYGPTWRGPFQDMETCFYEEWYWIYYNTGGKAVRLEREMVKGPGENITVELDEEAPEIEEGA